MLSDFCTRALPLIYIYWSSKLNYTTNVHMHISGVNTCSS